MGGTRNGRPRPLGDETEHYWLVQRMAKETGVDLVAAMEAGLLTQEEWTGIVTCCRGCDWSEGCGRWLDRSAGVPRALPGSCPNRKRLAEIKTALEAP